VRKVAPSRDVEFWEVTALLSLRVFRGPSEEPDNMSCGVSSVKTADGARLTIMYSVRHALHALRDPIGGPRTSER
jgi:hypothetical protein